MFPKVRIDQSEEESLGIYSKKKGIPIQGRSEYKLEKTLRGFRNSKTGTNLNNGGKASK